MDHLSSKREDEVDGEEHSPDRPEDDESEDESSNENETASEYDSEDESEYYYQDDSEDTSDSDDGACMADFECIPTGLDSLPKHIHEYEEIKDFTIREGSKLTLRNIAELWPNLESPSITHVSDDTIDEYFDLMVYDEGVRRWNAWMQRRTSFDRLDPPLIVKMATVRQVFEATGESTLGNIPSKGQYAYRRLGHYWPYVRDDKWLLVRLSCHKFSSFTLYGTLGSEESRTCLKNLESFYRRQGVRFNNSSRKHQDHHEDDIYDCSDYNQSLDDGSDPGLQLLIRTRDRVRGNSFFLVEEDRDHKKLLMFFELLCGDHHARMHLARSASSEYCAKLINELEQRLVQQYAQHGPLGKNNLKLLREIADEHQEDPKKRDSGLSLAKTVVVLSHWSAERYKGFFSP